MNLPIADVPVREVMRERLGMPVFVDNDANAAALAEHRHGAARGATNAVVLTIGTGVGGGLIVNGEVYRGSTGAGAELGHVVVDADGPPCQGNCPNHGCVETMASGTALAREGRAAAEADPDSALGKLLSAGQAIDGRAVTDAAQAGDRAARVVIERAGHYLGVAMASFANVFDPDVIVVGGGVTAGAGELLLAPARAELAARALTPQNQTPVLVAELGSDAGMIGAATMAAEELEKQLMAGRLTVCPTPIGNLGDLTDRARQALTDADLVACEDTRRTGLLYERLELSQAAPGLQPRGQRGRARAADRPADRAWGAGGPHHRRRDARRLGSRVPPDPCLHRAWAGRRGAARSLGRDHRPCRLGAASRTGGVSRASCRAAPASWSACSPGGETVVAFESPRRLPDSLAALATLAPERPAAVCRELTKLHEEVARGTLSELARRFREDVKGEIVVVIAPPEGSSSSPDTAFAVDALRRLVQAGARPRAAASVVAALTGTRANDLYTGLTGREPRQ